MKKILAAMVLSVVVVGIPSPANATRDTAHKKYRCAPGHSVCRLQVRTCTITGFTNAGKPIRYCTKWRYVSWAR